MITSKTLIRFTVCIHCGMDHEDHVGPEKKCLFEPIIFTQPSWQALHQLFLAAGKDGERMDPCDLYRYQRMQIVRVGHGITIYDDQLLVRAYGPGDKSVYARFRFSELMPLTFRIPTIQRFRQIYLGWLHAQSLGYSWFSKSQIILIRSELNAGWDGGHPLDSDQVRVNFRDRRGNWQGKTFALWELNDADPS